MILSASRPPTPSPCPLRRQFISMEIGISETYLKVLENYISHQDDKVPHSLGKLDFVDNIGGRNVTYEPFSSCAECKVTPKDETRSLLTWESRNLGMVTQMQIATYADLWIHEADAQNQVECHNRLPYRVSFRELIDYSSPACAPLIVP